MKISLKTKMIAAFVLMLTLFQGVSSALEISNPYLKAVWNHDGLSLWNCGESSPYLTNAVIGSNPCTLGQIEKVDNPLWGQGWSIIMEDESGDSNRLALFERLPFAVLQRTIVNQQSEEKIVEKDAMLSGAVDLGMPPDQLKTMSTAGLRDVDDNPGGYAFITIADPVSRRGIVGGWLTHEKGSGILFSDVQNNKAIIRARIDYGDLRIPSREAVKTEIFLVGYFNDVRDGLEQYADAIERKYNIQLPNQPTVYCTWYHAGASDENKIAKNTDFAKERLASYGFSVMQIDDKWQAGVSQNGPCKDFSKVKPDGPYPSGMKKTADYIKAQGLTPGLWFMPFAGTWNDPYWKDKQDLFYREGRSEDNYISETNNKKRPNYPPGEAPYVAFWGGACLDMTNPKSQNYLCSIVDRITHEWGYKYLKMDGLWMGVGARIQYVNSFYKDDDLGKTKRFNPSLTPVEAYRKGLHLIRRTAGKDVFLLGCCQAQNQRSFGPAMGILDAMRVGPDNGANPKGLIRGPQFTTRLYFLNKRVWHNDPDPVYVRPSFPIQMARTSVSWTSLTGSLHSSSYSYYELPEERLDILLCSMPVHDLKTVRPVDYLENDPARVWRLKDERGAVRKDVIGLFNWDIENSVRVEYPLDRMDLPKADAYVGYEFWSNTFYPPFSESICADLPPGGCSIVSIRPVVNHPQVISTSRHLTQGVVDLRNEQWDEANHILSGVSQVIGGEEYELRVVLPDLDNHPIDKMKMTTKPSDAAISWRRDGALLRVKILSCKNGSVEWRIRFE